MNTFSHEAIFIGEISTLTNYLKFNFEYVVEDCRKRQINIVFESTSNINVLKTFVKSMLNAM